MFPHFVMGTVLLEVISRVDNSVYLSGLRVLYLPYSHLSSLRDTNPLRWVSYVRPWPSPTKVLPNRKHDSTWLVRNSFLSVFYSVRLTLTKLNKESEFDTLRSQSTQMSPASGNRGGPFTLSSRNSKTGSSVVVRVMVTNFTQSIPSKPRFVFGVEIKVFD